MKNFLLNLKHTYILKVDHLQKHQEKSGLPTEPEGLMLPEVLGGQVTGTVSDDSFNDKKQIKIVYCHKRENFIILFVSIEKSLSLGQIRIYL